LSEPLGVFGGTFDPVHFGHLRLAEEAIDQLGLGGVRWIPAGQPPHRGAPQVTAQQRLEMVLRSTAENERFSVDAGEVEAAAPSYTVHTLERLRGELGDGQPLVLLAGALEVFWPIGMKNSQGFTKPLWVVVMVLAMCASFGLLSLAVSKRFGLPIGTAYAVWTGIGAAGAGAVGIILFRESANFWRLLFLAMVIIGIVGLKFSHQIHEEDQTPALQPAEAPAPSDQAKS